MLFYNRDLFEQNGVKLPRDQMSWSEVFDLAKRFPTTGDEATRIYGFFQNNYGPTSFYQLASTVGGVERLSLADPETLKVTLDTEDWKRVFQTTLDALNSKAINTETTNSTGTMTYEDSLKRDYFVTGRAAMTLGSYGTFDQIKQAKAQIKDYQEFNWDVVTVPVDPKNPDVTTNGFGLYQLFAINAQSTEQRAAWEFVKYLNSDEYARVISRFSQELLSRTSYIKEMEGHNLNVFSSLKRILLPI